MTVYLLHFTKRISPNHTCQHYIGTTEELTSRLQAHHNGDAARLTEVAAERNIGFVLARLWAGGRKEERYLKNLKNGHKLCPICNGGQGRQVQKLTEIKIEDYLRKANNGTD